MHQVTAMVRDAQSIAGRVEGEWRDGRLQLAGELSGLVDTKASLETDLPLLIEPMSLAALTAGADGLIVESHVNPSCALCDGPQQLDGKMFPPFAKKLKKLHSLLQQL